jgi:hypothetical protein
MTRSYKATGMPDAGIGHAAANGASNMYDGLQQFKWNSQFIPGEELTTTKCAPHQNQRSARFASGNGDFKVNSNPDLGKSLSKNHEIHTQLSRSNPRG